MKALVYHGGGDVRRDDKPRTKIHNPDDAILHLTSTADIYSSESFFYAVSVQGMELYATGAKHV
jgi:threonine dehydrogenase-like Zn-dependent dehydrogenase